MKNDETQEYKNLLRSAEEDYKTSVKDKEDVLRKHYEDKISTLNKENKRLQVKVGENNQDSSRIVATSKIESLEKKIAYYEKEVTNLSDNINKKNEELMKLRSQNFEVERAKSLKKNYETLEREKDQLKDTLKSKSR